MDSDMDPQANINFPYWLFMELADNNEGGHKWKSTCQE